jgi:hypothetical protein
MMPIRGDIRVNQKYAPGTPPEQITEFDIWDGERWIPAATARDLLYNIGSAPKEEK